MSFAPDITTGGWLSQRAAREGHRPALTFEGTTWTFAELMERIDRLAAALRDGGVDRGDRVGFLGVNQPAALLTMVAVSRIGAPYVPLNFRLAGPELEFIINDAGLHTLITGAETYPVIDSIREAVSVSRYLVTETTADGWESFESVIDSTDPLTEIAPGASDDLGIIMYTSGTTGVPKGVMMTHSNLWWNLISLLNTYDVCSEEVTLTGSPLFHIAGLNVTIFTTWMRCGDVILHRNFDPQATLDDI